MNKVVIDATRGVLGRIASYAAKQALKGNEVIVVNCADVVISGNERTTINEYISLRSKGGSSLKGPFFPKEPYRIVKRTIRGMLPHFQERGKKALKRVRCFNNLPSEYSSYKTIKFENTLKCKVIDLNTLSKEI